MRINQRMLRRLQITPIQHSGEIRTHHLDERRETSAERPFDRYPTVKGAVLTLPTTYRVISTRRITGSQPSGGAIVVDTPVEVVNEQPPMRAKQPAERRGDSIQLSMVEHHDGNDRVKQARVFKLLDGFANQSRVSRSGRVYA